METNLIKPKRVRRTKEQMMAFRQAQTESSKLPKEAAFRDSQRFNAEVGIPEPKKVAQKSNMAAEQDVLKPMETTIMKCIPGVGYKETKQIEGWVNVYKGGPGSYWLGSDIHYTVESAKKIGGHSATAKIIKQIFISFVDGE